MENLQAGSDVFFVLLGAILVLFMHSGFAFLEVGTVREKNQVNALVKIFSDFAVSTIAYFFIGYQVAYGVGFFESAGELSIGNGYELVKFFFLLTFAAAIPAIISGGIAERAKFYPQLLASVIIVALVYPLFEGVVWNGNYGLIGRGHQWIGCHELAHGYGGWCTRGIDCRQSRSRLFAQWPAGRSCGCVRRLGCHAPDRLARSRCHRRAAVCVDLYARAKPLEDR